MFSNQYSQAILEVGWKQNNLTLLYKPIQLRFLQKWKISNSNLFCVHISRQVGKSHAALLYAIQECRANPNFRVVFVSHVEKKLEQYFSDLTNRALSTCPQELKPRYVNSSLQFDNGSEILLASDANKAFESQRGQRYNLIILDEFAFYDRPEQLLWEVLFPTITTTKGKILICTTSPDNGTHYSNELFARAKLEGWYYFATIYDDETFTQEEIAQLKKDCFSEFAWRINYLCELGIVNAEKRIVPSWDESKYKISKVILDTIKNQPEHQFYRYFESLDMGIRDKTVCLIGFYNFLEATLYIEKEIVMNGPEMTTKKFGDKLLEIEQKLNLRYRDERLQREVDRVYMRIGDSNNLLLFNDLVSTHNISFLPTGKEHLNQMVNAVDVMASNGRIKVSEECLFLLGSLHNCIWDKDRKEFERSKLFGHADAIASLVYMVRNLVESNPIPSTFGLHPIPGSQVLPPHLQHLQNTDPNKEILKQSFGLNKLNRISKGYTGESF